MRKTTILALILLTLARAGSFAQEQPGENAGRERTNGFLVLPIVFYTPETRIAGGALLNYYFREESTKPNSRLSSIVPSVIYTQNDQVMGDLLCNLYLFDNMYHWNGYFGYARFPGKFYGIGNDSRKEDEEGYTSRSVNLRVNFQRRVYTGLSVGLRFELEQLSVLDRAIDGRLASGIIAGSRGGRASGLGVAAEWDTRDNPFAPSMGEYYQVSVVRFGGFMAGDYAYTRADIDLRSYCVSDHADVFAVQTLASLSSGTPPFSMLPKLGGQSILRGFYEGRFRDRNLIALQAEYRVPLWWRFNVAGFAECGEVAADMDRFSLAGLKYSYGAGLRYAINPEERLFIRMDFGMSSESSGLYITIGEAF
jgi:outer membrane protein assembly factor BamA